MPTNDERRNVAKTLRRVAAGNTASLSDGEFVDFVEEIVLGGDVRMDPQCHDTMFLNRLADLIDPTAHERTVVDNLRIIDRNRQLEIELGELKVKVGRVFRIVARLRGEYRMAVLRAGDAPVPSSVADRFEIAEEIAAEIAEAIR